MGSSRATDASQHRRVLELIRPMPTGAKARRNMSRFVALGTLAWSACVGPQRPAAVAQRPAANASAVSSDASRPFDLQALLKREATGLTLHTFRALNGTFAAAVDARAAPKIGSTDRATAVRVP